MTPSSRNSNQTFKPEPMLATPNPRLTKADMRNIFYGLMLGMFLSALNQTIVATALPTIGRDFGDFENLSWVIISYLLSSTVVSPLYGKLSDIHGRRSMMLVALGLFIAAATLLLIALTSGGTRVAWMSPTILVLVAMSLALTVAFLWWLKRVPEPFLPLNVLRNPVMRAGTAATSCTLGAVLGLTVYMPLYLQVVHKLSATDAGLALIPVVVMTTPGSMLSGRAMMYLRHYKV